MTPNKINSELERILTKRIKKLVLKAKYYPSKVYIHKDTAAVLKPYLELSATTASKK